jgi:hypothetical protein
MQNNTTSTAAPQFIIKTLDTFWAGEQDRDAEGFRVHEPTSWKEAKATFWTIVQNHRSEFKKGQSWEKGVFIFDAAGNEIISETTDNLGSVSYSEIVKP